jgi:ABC-2 type transport system ATP-binding protein
LLQNTEAYYFISTYFLMYTLIAEGLSKQYADFTALSNLNLSIAKGEVFCLLGQNGAGKTTTINLFLGFINATSGKAFINNIDVAVNPTKAKQFIAYIPEVVQLYGNLTGVENLDFFCRLAGFKYKKEDLNFYLLKAGLQIEAHHKKMQTYSKGMRQKVAIAIALAKNADVIFMDEPTSGLDPKATKEFTNICKTLALEGKTIFMATHDIFNAVNVASNIGIMKQGQLIHTISANQITASALQELYLQTI